MFVRKDKIDLLEHCVIVRYNIDDNLNRSMLYYIRNKFAV